MEGNTQAAVRMCLECFPNRRQRSHVLFGQLRETGAFQLNSHIGRERTTCAPVAEETVRREFDMNPQTSLRANAFCVYIALALCAYSMRRRNTPTTLKDHLEKPPKRRPPLPPRKVLRISKRME